MLYTPITKAIIKFSKNNKWQGKGEQVLINPSKIVFDMHKETKFISGTGGAPLYKVSQSLQAAKNVKVELIFDLVDKYEKAFQDNNGTYVSVSNGSNFSDDDTSVGLNNIHVYNKDLCCYSNIYESFLGNNVIRFSWGSYIDVIGKILDYSSELTYFSPDGDPLRALVYITIGREDVGLT